jgi:hypothetical protein
VNESGFTQALHLKLPKQIYRWKISDRFSAGVADAYYSSPRGDLWVEYKFYPRGLPRKVKPRLSKLQQKWLRERHEEGRNVAVIVGSPTTCLLYRDKSWTDYKSPKDEGMTRQELVTWFKEELCTT